ncbi:RagB/SusD family nutrient uptake outer membrane protein [Chitinophaga oryziterrae]|uniref:RagB/SusD family nutrient uptake outer membrane protein n=1 Tax=Chitinophaga oryziterrae TaxID=1031224 RepID=A0A6N8JAE8_9BACT|nr:RagB/SusD family nutrient uptake outer membrane protein [Chitinophaga oryziterrae]MVT42265.1 RagB/SusD family nutrient uptake outer membrane protein [Chitinophaga oryziterrae]
MKKLSIIIMLTGAVFFTACKKYLDEQPQDSVSQQTYWNTEADAVNAVNNCYRRLGDVDNRIFISCATDDSYSWSDWPSDVRLVGNGSASSGTGVFSNFWSNLYKMIASCNDVLDNIDRDKALTDSMNLRLKGEARFIRAYAYQQLTGMFGAVPLITHIQAVSEFKAARTSKDSIARFIVDEVDAISPHLPIAYGTTDQGRVTRGAALALKARILLYVGRNSEAATAAKAVMDLGYYAIDKDYVSLFNGTNKTSLEIIFAAAYVKTTLPSAMATWVGGPSLGGWSQVVPLQSLVDAYECTDGKTIDKSAVYDAAHPYDNRDPRLKMTVVVPGVIVNGDTIDVTNKNGLDALSKNNASFSGFYYKKYVPADIQGNWDSNSYNDVVLIRYAEVLLIYAEAKIEMGQIDQSVYDAINAVRQRPGVMMPALTAATVSGQADMRDAVRRERHVEFPMEDNRLFDIRRWQIAETVMTGTAYGILNNYDNSRADYGKHVVVEQRTFVKPRDYLWAIPQGEVALNPNLLPNNTGW